MHTTTELFHLLSLICCAHSMSLGMGYAATVNDAVDAAVTAVCERVWGGNDYLFDLYPSLSSLPPKGVNVIVAAGNDGIDACKRSPSSASKVLVH